ncbi:MAG: glutathione S-transferase family protein [Burkholderiaceae bacterium]|jgi:glutathione S-transferase|nr:glutathione S-transferase family protein [Burkholderiaceae bacterium]
MITLCGITISNYYNKVKLALLEKGVPFTEEVCKTGSQDEAVLACTPLGKVPFIRTERGALCESEAIMAYIEATWPTPALMPADAWERAKLQELTLFIDLHLELVARQLYGQAFFGGEALSDANKARIRKQLVKNIAGFKRLAKFAPYVGGDSFTQADCAAYVSLPLVALSSRIALGEDLLAAAGIDWKAYAALIGQRPSAQRVDADRKAGQAQLAKT